MGWGALARRFDSLTSGFSADAARSWKSEHGTHHFQNLVWRALDGGAHHGGAAPRGLVS